MSISGFIILICKDCAIIAVPRIPFTALVHTHTPYHHTHVPHARARTHALTYTYMRARTPKLNSPALQGDYSVRPIASRKGGRGHAKLPASSLFYRSEQRHLLLRRHDDVRRLGGRHHSSHFYPGKHCHCQCIRRRKDH